MLDNKLGLKKDWCLTLKEKIKSYFKVMLIWSHKKQSAYLVKEKNTKTSGVINQQNS